MGLKNMSLVTGATLAATGGNALVFADDGVTIPNGLHLIVPADASFQTRRQATAKYKQPTLDPKTGVYSKDRKSISFTEPILVDGKVWFNVIRVERETHPSTENDDAARLNEIGAQLLFSADTASFWATGSFS